MKKENSQTPKKLSPRQKKQQKRSSQRRIHKDEILSLCEKGVSLNEIAQRLNITTLSAATYIERLLRKGYAIPVDRYITPEKRNDIEEHFLNRQTASIKRVAESLKGNATEEEIRIVRGYIQGKMRSECGKQSRSR